MKNGRVPLPDYSMAVLRRNQRSYQIAIREVLKQLNAFPDDFTGWMMLAEIHAFNLNDYKVALPALERACNAPNAPVARMVEAIHLLADWHVNLNDDRQMASQLLEKISWRYPNTQYAQDAQAKIVEIKAHVEGAQKKNSIRVKLPNT